MVLPCAQAGIVLASSVSANAFGLPTCCSLSLAQRTTASECDGIYSVAPLSPFASAIRPQDMTNGPPAKNNPLSYCGYRVGGHVKEHAASLHCGTNLIPLFACHAHFIVFTLLEVTFLWLNVALKLLPHSENYHFDDDRLKRRDCANDGSIRPK